MVTDPRRTGAGPAPGRITGLQDSGRELSLARQQAGVTIREVSCAR